MSERAYPLPHPESGSDPRFTFGLTHDIGKLLEAAGYPPVKAGRDIVELQLALFRFIYQPEPVGAPGANREHVPGRHGEDEICQTCSDRLDASILWPCLAGTDQARAAVFAEEHGADNPDDLTDPTTEPPGDAP